MFRRGGGLSLEKEGRGMPHGGPGKEDEIQETDEALAKVRQALRTLVDIE